VRALLALLLILAAPAAAQDWITPAGGQKAGMITAYDQRQAAVPGLRQVETARFIYSVVPQGSISFQWALFVQQLNFSDAGENAPVYVKGYKHARAAGWGAVIEAQDYYPGIDGQNLFGIELDYMGSRGRNTTGAGLFIVLGRSSKTPIRDPTDVAVSTLDMAMLVAPYVPDWGFVRLNYGVRFAIDCDVACLSMQGGSAVKFSDDPNVPVHRFDPPTGFIGYWRGTGAGRVCVWCTHALDGTNVRTNWTVP